MFRAHPLDRVVFSLILPSRRDSEDRSDASTCYIGLGDQFDDDRRVVREAASAVFGQPGCAKRVASSENINKR